MKAPARLSRMKLPRPSLRPSRTPRPHRMPRPLRRPSLRAIASRPRSRRSSPATRPSSISSSPCTRKPAHPIGFPRSIRLRPAQSMKCCRRGLCLHGPEPRLGPNPGSNPGSTGPIALASKHALPGRLPGKPQKRSQAPSLFRPSRLSRMSPHRASFFWPRSPGSGSLETENGPSPSRLPLPPFSRFFCSSPSPSAAPAGMHRMSAPRSLSPRRPSPIHRRMCPSHRRLTRSALSRLLRLPFNPLTLRSPRKRQALPRTLRPPTLLRRLRFSRR